MSLSSGLKGFWQELQQGFGKASREYRHKTPPFRCSNEEASRRPDGAIPCPLVRYLGFRFRVRV